jgi:archaellum component FlaC
MVGICNNDSDILCSIKIGNDLVNISKNGRHFLTLLNKRAVLESKSEKDMINRTLPVLSIFIKSLCKQSGIKNITASKGNNYQKMLDSIINNVSKNLYDSEVAVLETVPDEITDNIPSERTANNDICKSLSDISENIEGVVRNASTLLKTNLPKNMWGGREVTAIFQNTKNSLNDMSEKLEYIEECIEKTSDLNRHLNVFRDKLSNSNLRVIMGNIINNFSSIKTVISELSQNLYNLYNIDPTFKKCTGYPATWFLNSSILYDFLFEFEALIDHLIKLSRIEESTIKPLLVWKVQNGEINNV